MAKLFQTVLMVAAIAVCTAEPIQFRPNGRNVRFFARQEEAPSSSPAPAPYPPAGVTPSVAFELPTEQTTVKPDNTYLPPAPEPTPDQTYGPPDNTYGPPDNTYGPPAPAAAPSDAQPDVAPQRLVFVANKRRGAERLTQDRRPKQVFNAARFRSAPLEIVRSEPILAYSVQYKSF